MVDITESTILVTQFVTYLRSLTVTKSVELSVTLQQEAKSQNLFNEDEEDIERYIDDDDDDFVDHVRFQSQQVRKHLYTVHHHFQSLAGFPHLTTPRIRNVPLVKD